MNFLISQKFNIKEIAFDRWGAVQMSQNLESLGFTVVQFGQGFRDMSPPTKELMKLTLEGKLAHNGHPVLRWMMANIFIKRDPAGNIKPDKEKSTEKIDGAVALVIKKFLYSDHEIFLRELVSNAVDATQKLRTLASFGDFKGVQLVPSSRLL